MTNDLKPRPMPTGNPAAHVDDSGADDPRIMKAVQDYLADLDKGQVSNRSEYLKRNPEIADALKDFLDALELLHNAAPMQAVHSTTNAAADETSDVFQGNPLGDFQIVREIGRGGMGIVYEAVQLSLGRRVALKVLPLAATFDTKCLQRFRNEAQAAASLHHTNIVPVYAVGCERGVHFYAMQLIEGHSLASILLEVRRSENSAGEQESANAHDLLETASHISTLDRKRPSIPGVASLLSQSLSANRSDNRGEYYRSIVRIIVQAAEGLEHAHEYGIVHRDIKPANLLVDMHGRLWITDFGLAQFHRDAGLTRTGDLLGTLRYMSPEQASGRRTLIDHRCDIYSLGATLYELATLRPMFSGQNHHELLNQILNEEPPAPRTIDRGVPVELETIILKAVNKNPADRYSSEKEFAADLQRFLAYQPIHAKRPGFVDRFRKWCRRHPSAVTAAVVLLCFGVLGLALSTYFVAGAYDRERMRAEEAEERFILAKRSTDEMIRIAQEDLADNPMMQDVRRRLLEAALTYYQEFIEQRRERPDSQAELTKTRDLVKTILADLVVLQGAGKYFLLKDASVQDDLGVSTDQRHGLKHFFDRLDSRRQEIFETLRKLPPDDRQKHFAEIVRSNDALVATVLTPAQLDRLSQICRQSQGAAAFRDSEVVQDLKLSAKQRRQIQEIEVRTFADFAVPGGQKREPHGVWKDELRAAMLADIRSVLTAEQSRRWDEMTGRTFPNAERIFVPGPPGGPMPPGSPFPGAKFDHFRPK